MAVCFSCRVGVLGLGVEAAVEEEEGSPPGSSGEDEDRREVDEEVYWDLFGVV